MQIQIQTNIHFSAAFQSPALGGCTPATFPARIKR